MSNIVPPNGIGTSGNGVSHAPSPLSDRRQDEHSPLPRDRRTLGAASPASSAGGIEDRSTGGPAKRSAAAKAGALTRKRRAATGRTPATRPATTGKKRPA